jgi:hypothetical protein
MKEIAPPKYRTDFLGRTLPDTRVRRMHIIDTSERTIAFKARTRIVYRRYALRAAQAYLHELILTRSSRSWLYTSRLPC